MRALLLLLPVLQRGRSTLALSSAAALALLAGMLPEAAGAGERRGDDRAAPGRSSMRSAAAVPCAAGVGACGAGEAAATAAEDGAAGMAPAAAVAAVAAVAAAVGAEEAAEEGVAALTAGAGATAAAVGEVAAAGAGCCGLCWPEARLRALLPMGASTGEARGRVSQVKGVSTGGGVRTCTRTGGARMLRGLSTGAACSGGGARWAGSGGRVVRLLLLGSTCSGEEAALGLPRCSVKAREAPGRKESCSGGARGAGACATCGCRWRAGEPPPATARLSMSGGQCFMQGVCVPWGRESCHLLQGNHRAGVTVFRPSALAVSGCSSLQLPRYSSTRGLGA